MASKEYVTLLTERYPQLKPIGDQIEAAYKILETCYEQGGKLLIAGNGGSCADAEHIVGELMKGFVKRRRVSKEEQDLLEQAGTQISQNSQLEENLGKELAECLQGGLPAIALTGHTGLSTAFLNDVNGEMIYAQQLWGYATTGRRIFGDFHIWKFQKYSVRSGCSQSKGVKNSGTNRKRRRKTGKISGCGHHRARAGNL